MSAAFLHTYLEVARPGHFLPANPAHLQILLDAYLLEKALYELVYELSSRPHWGAWPDEGRGEVRRGVGCPPSGATH